MGEGTAQGEGWVGEGKRETWAAAECSGLPSRCQGFRRQGVKGSVTYQLIPQLIPRRQPLRTPNAAQPHQGVVL